MKFTKMVTLVLMLSMVLFLKVSHATSYNTTDGYTVDEPIMDTQKAAIHANETTVVMLQWDSPTATNDYYGWYIPENFEVVSTHAKITNDTCTVSLKFSQYNAYDTVRLNYIDSSSIYIIGTTSIIGSDSSISNPYLTTGNFIRVELDSTTGSITHLKAWLRMIRRYRANDLR